MSDWYILDANNNPVKSTLREARSWVDSLPKDIRTGAGRIVKVTDIDDIRVSTVFLSMDHSWGPNAVPVLFETLIMNGPGRDGEIERYCTWDEAIQGHDRIVAEVAAAMNDHQRIVGEIEGTI